MPPLRVGMFGGGTVGGGVYELLQNRAATVVIDKICVKNLDKKRDFDAPTSIFTTNPDEILQNDNIDCVVEVMGGTGFAKTVVLSALSAGKSVVTANKALLAEHLEQVRQAAVVAHKPLMYEAAVCGGIPIINALQTAHTGDEIFSVQGIANGTTNYMLTKMETENADYATVLKEAQDLGYAEADPTADVEGHDVRAKIALLAKLAFGTTVPVDKIPCVGISKISSEDFAVAKARNLTIKLIGTAAKNETTGALAVYVSPVLLNKTTSFLAGIHGAGNAIQVVSRNLSTCLYTGPGAGRYPTANSVVADILRLATMPTMGSAVDPFPLETTLALDPSYTAEFYVRLGHLTREYVKKTATVAGIHLVQEQLATATKSLIVHTLECSSKAMDAWCKKIHDETKIHPVVIPILP